MYSVIPILQKQTDKEFPKVPHVMHAKDTNIVDSKESLTKYFDHFNWQKPVYYMLLVRMHTYNGIPTF